MNSKYADLIPTNVYEAYSEPHRKYHNVAHLEYMLDKLYVFYPHLDKELHDAVVWAILYHDIVYDIPAKEISNEKRSALQFLKEHIDEPNAFVIAHAIECTETHILNKFDGLPGSVVHHLVDLDLWALSDEEAYAKNNISIKLENNATDEQWRKGRGAWLTKFLERDQIYYTDIGKTREAEARRILQADLDQLTNG